MLPAAVASIRAGDHRTADGIRRELVQQPVLRSAADDVQDAEAVSDELIQHLQHAAILQRQALEHDAGIGPMSVGTVWPVRATGLGCAPACRRA